LNEKIKAPFPYTRGFKTEIISTLKVCLIATLIILFIKPFGLEEADSSVILGFGFTVFLSALFNIAVSTYIIKSLIIEENWAVWKEILRSLAYLCINILAIILFANYNLNVILDGLTIFKFIGFTILIGIIPITIRVLRINNWLLKIKLKEAQGLSKMLKERKNENEMISFELRSNIVNEFIQTNTEQFQYIEADKNYIMVTELKENKLISNLLRLSLLKALEQIEDEFIIRCHRSFVVNLKAVERVSGNSQGLKLILNKNENPIPVSRTYKKEVSAKLAALK